MKLTIARLLPVRGIQRSRDSLILTVHWLERSVCERVECGAAPPNETQKCFSLKLSSHCAVISHLRGRQSDTWLPWEGEKVSDWSPRTYKSGFPLPLAWLVIRRGSLLMCHEIHIWLQPWFADALCPWSEMTGALEFCACLLCTRDAEAFTWWEDAGRSLKRWQKFASLEKETQVCCFPGKEPHPGSFSLPYFEHSSRQNTWKLYCVWWRGWSLCYTSLLSSECRCGINSEENLQGLAYWATSC